MFASVFGVKKISGFIVSLKKATLAEPTFLDVSLQ